MRRKHCYSYIHIARSSDARCLSQDSTSTDDTPVSGKVSLRTKIIHIHIACLLEAQVDLVLYSSKILSTFAKEGKFPFKAMAAIYIVLNS